MANITLGGKPCTTNGDLPSRGSGLKDYQFVKHDMSTLNLSTLHGKKVILNIFPSVDTSVCATSVRKFNEYAAGLDNTAVVCISRDLPFAQARFCGAEGIDNVITASDFRTPEFAEDLGIRIADGPFSGLDARSIVVLDEEGKVLHTELVSEVGNEPDYDAALNAVK